MLQRSPRASRRRSIACSTAAVSSLVALAACSAPPGADDVDGVPNFGAPVAPVTNGQAGAATVPGAAPGVGTAPPTASTGGEQNPAVNAPITPGTAPSAGGAGSAGASGGAGGASAVPPGAVAGAAGASLGVAGSDTGVGGAGAVPPPVAPNDPTPEEITTFFQSLPCGAQYGALGDGGWQFCLRLADGGGACTRGTAAFQRVTFQGGAPVTDVAQISGQRDSGVGVVTSAGALHIGGVTSISTTPLIASGVVNYSGGYHASAALVEQGEGFGVLSWMNDDTPAPVTLPNGAQPIQVSANYGLACALSTAGDVYCWNAGGNHSLQQLTDAPTDMQLARAVQMISVGQNGVCGVSFDNTLECQVAWYDSPFLPTEGAAPNFQIRQSSFPSVASVRIGFGQGIIVRTDGTAAFLQQGGASPPADNAGQAFTGVSGIVAAGGDRGSACVLTGAGSVFCHNGTAAAQATLDGAPLTAQAAACPL